MGNIKKMTLPAILAFSMGCAGLDRSCQSWGAENFAADWLVTSYNNLGEPTHCWKLPYTSIANEQASDGIYWVDGTTDNLVHISGWYNRVQVKGGQWNEAAKHLGIDLEKCTDGLYQALPKKDG